MIKPSDITLIVGVVFSIAPFFIWDKINIFGFLMICFGAVLAGISRADSISLLSGKDSVGDEFIRDFIHWIKKK